VNEVNICMAIRPAQNVVSLFGICDDALDGKLRIVMELCTHGSLRDYVKGLPPSQVCEHASIWVSFQWWSAVHDSPHVCGVCACVCHTYSACSGRWRRQRTHSYSWRAV
jgi:hypothetical protein